MLQLWTAEAIMIQAMEILFISTDYTKFLHCIANSEDYNATYAETEFLQVCLRSSGFYISLRLVLVPIQIIFSIIAIFGLISRHSIYMIPWLVFIGFNESHDCIMLLYRDYDFRKNLAYTLLFACRYIVAWLFEYYNYRRIRAEENTLQQIVEGNKRTSVDMSESSRHKTQSG